MSKASKLDGCELALTGCPWASCLTSLRFQCPHSEKGVSYILAITVIAISIYWEWVKGFTNITWLNPLNISVRVVQSLSCVQLCDPMDCSTLDLYFGKWGSRGTEKLLKVAHRGCGGARIIKNLPFQIYVRLRDNPWKVSDTWKIL